MIFQNIIRSLIKKIYKIRENNKSKKLKKSFRIAEYKSALNKKYLLFENKNISFILKRQDYISKQIFIEGEYDYKYLKKGLQHIKNNKKKFLINIGAHVGTTLIPAIKDKIFNKFIAFEPSLNNYRLLNANIHINKIEHQGKVFKLALSNKIGKKYLKNYPNNTGFNHISIKKKKH